MCCNAEIWPTGGWGSLEYGTPVKGQVIGGRWKPLHHMMAQSAYTDVTAACGSARITMMDADDKATGPALCYVRNDLPTPFSGVVTVETIQLSSGHVTPLNSVAAKLPAGASTHPSSRALHAPSLLCVLLCSPTPQHVHASYQRSGLRRWGCARLFLRHGQGRRGCVCRRPWLR